MTQGRDSTPDIEIEAGDWINLSGKVDTQMIQLSDGSTLVYTKHEVSKDYKGNPSLLVYFDFTNNSDDSKAAMMIHFYA